MPRKACFIACSAWTHVERSSFLPRRLALGHGRAWLRHGHARRDGRQRGAAQHQRRAVDDPCRARCGSSMPTRSRSPRLLLAGGGLANRFGARAVYAAGIAAFVAASSAVRCGRERSRADRSAAAPRHRSVVVHSEFARPTRACLSRRARARPRPGPCGAPSCRRSCGIRPARGRPRDHLVGMARHLLAELAAGRVGHMARTPPSRRGAPPRAAAASGSTSVRHPCARRAGLRSDPGAERRLGLAARARGGNRCRAGGHCLRASSAARDSARCCRAHCCTTRHSFASTPSACSSTSSLRRALPDDALQPAGAPSEPARHRSEPAAADGHVHVRATSSVPAVIARATVITLRCGADTRDDRGGSGGHRCRRARWRTAVVAAGRLHRDRKPRRGDRHPRGDQQRARPRSTGSTPTPRPRSSTPIDRSAHWLASRPWA